MNLRHPICLAIVACALSLTACGFHLRASAQLPAGMQRVHLNISGHGDFPRELARAITVAGSTIEDQPGPGIAELNVPVAQFSTDVLSTNGYSRVGEYAVRYHVEFNATDASGHVIVAPQTVNMSREYTYDSRATIGSETQNEEIQRSLVTDMARSILFRLQAAARNPAAQTTSTP